MAKNDTILVESILEERQKINHPSNDVGEVFELFSNEQIMRDYDLCQTDFQLANVDGKDDGGIDSFYVFVNGILLNDNLSEFRYPKTQIELTVILIQSKHAEKFEQSTVNSLYTSIAELFDLSKDNSNLDGDYNKEVLAKRRQFIAAYKATACNLSNLNFKFYYASMGDVENVGENTIARAEQIKTKMSELFSQCSCSFDFVGASELLGLYRKQNNRKLTLPFVNSISASGKCFVALCNIKDYYRFITDENGNLKRFIFDSNVRDYMGLNHVNADILETLSHQGNIEFWWLNNGVTILASSAVDVGTALTINDVQVVNGLQTSYSIYEYFKNGGSADDRKVLIKVISSEIDATRDKIIQATNNQTPVELKSLYATDKIQQDIEAAFKDYDIYYERRINFYANQGFDREKIYDMMYVAGASIALLAKSPESAVTLKQKMFKETAKYDAIFNPDYDIRVWPKMAMLLRKIDNTLLGSSIFRKSTNSADKRLKKARYVVGLIVLGRLFGTYNFSAKKIAEMDNSQITEQHIMEAMVIAGFSERDYSKHLSRWRVVCKLNAAAEKWNIDGMEFIKHVTNEFVHQINNSKRNPISIEIVERVKSMLAPQPWPRDEHKRVAALLHISKAQVAKAIKYLIKNGDFYQQKDGILYNKEGKVIISNVVKS